MATATSRVIHEGALTATVYGLLRDEKYSEVVHLLTPELVRLPRSRALLSLLGYSYYQLQDYTNAARCYEQLVRLFPDVDSYKSSWAQSLCKAGASDEALRASQFIQDPQRQVEMLKLQGTVHFYRDNFTAAKTCLDQCPPEDPEILVMRACILFKEGSIDEARHRFQEAMGVMGYRPYLAYNLALCRYKQKQYGQAMRFVTEIIERGVREHPELSVGSNTEGIEVRSVGNSQTLAETALIEAFNLKAAMEWSLRNEASAREAINDMPPRIEEELDPVTLHNTALFHMDKNPTGGFHKLNFLIEQPSFPVQTFGNLLMLYCKHEYYDLAADVLAAYEDLSYQHLSPEMYEFVDATILTQTAPEEALRKFDVLTSRHIEHLRKLTKSIQDARLARDTEAVKRWLGEFDEALEKYIPVLMAMSRVYWDKENYPVVEKVLRQSGEFCSDHVVWKLNMAHVLFMQDKFVDAIHYYEPIVHEHRGNLLDVQPIVLANLCVSYIMSSQNEEAEEVMRSLEQEEEVVTSHGAEAQFFHLCIVNLVIGTLYCAKGNFEFGISRIIKSLDPLDKKLGPDTWYYTKRCLLSMAEMVAKHMLVLKDINYTEILDFLDAVDTHGKGIPATIAFQKEPGQNEKNNVSFEARLLKKVYLKLLG